MDDWDYIVVEGGLKLFNGGGVTKIIILVEGWPKLYFGRGVTEIILWVYWDYILLEDRLRLYCCGGLTEIILLWRIDWDYTLVEGWLILYSGGGLTDYRKLTHPTEQEDFLFCFIIWELVNFINHIDEGFVLDMIDNKHVQENRGKFILFHNIKKK